MSKRRPAPARAPEFDAAAVMARLKAGETVSIEDACKAATALGMRVELPPPEWMVRTPGRTAHGKIHSMGDDHGNENV